jgi:hypothetical protein
MDTFCVEGAKFSLSMTSTQMESSVRKRGLLFTFHAKMQFSKFVYSVGANLISLIHSF